MIACPSSVCASLRVNTSFLATALLPLVLSSLMCIFATFGTFVSFFVPTLTLSKTPPFLCQFLCRQPAVQGLQFFDLLFHHHLSLPFQYTCQPSCFWLSGKVHCATSSFPRICSSTRWHLSLMIVPNLFSKLGVSLTKVLRMSSHSSTSLALSHSEMLLINAAYADFLSDMFL